MILASTGSFALLSRNKLPNLLGMSICQNNQQSEIHYLKHQQLVVAPDILNVWYGLASISISLEAGTNKRCQLRNFGRLRDGL